MDKNHSKKAMKPWQLAVGIAIGVLAFCLPFLLPQSLPKEGKLSHAKVGAAVGQKAFDFHRPDGGAGSGKGGGAAVAAFPCYRHTGHQKGNGSAFWREREVLNGLFLHFYFRMKSSRRRILYEEWQAFSFRENIFMKVR